MKAKLCDKGKWFLSGIVVVFTRKHRPQTSDLENTDLENADLENTDLALKYKSLSSPFLFLLLFAV